MKLSRSIETYLENEGWSSKYFLLHAKYIFDHLPKHIKIDVGRTVIHLTGSKLVKAYVHHNGKSSEYVTLTDSVGNELATFRYDEVKPHELLQKIIELT